MKRLAGIFSGILSGIAALGALAFPQAATACAVCFGDPASPLVHGAQRGILVMLLVTYGVVIGLLGMLAFIIVRARRLMARTDPPGGPVPPSVDAARPHSAGA